MDTTSIIALTALANTVIVVPLTVLLTKGVDAYLRLRREKTSEDRHEEDRVDQNYQYLIGELKGELGTLRVAFQEMQAERTQERIAMQAERTEERTKLLAELSKIQLEHSECMRVQGELRGQLMEVKEMALRHDENNRKHFEQLQAELESQLRRKVDVEG